MIAMVVGGRFHGLWLETLDGRHTIVIPELPHTWIAQECLDTDPVDALRTVNYHIRWAKVTGWRIALPFWLSGNPGEIPAGTALPGVVVGSNFPSIRLEDEPLRWVYPS